MNAWLFLLGFLAFVAFFTLAAVQGTRRAGRIMGTRVHALHQAAESILATERIPSLWLAAPPAAPPRRRQWQRRQRRRALRKLGRLRAYMRSTPSIADVETREYVLAELERIGEQWRTRDWSLLMERKDLPERQPGA